MTEKEIPPMGGICGPKITARYTMAILGSIGIGIIYGLKVNLHVTIVTMVNHTAIALASPTSSNLALSAEETCANDNINSSSTGSTEDGPFDWSTNVQGTLLSAYFWGYIVSQLPGGRIAELFSAKMVMAFAVIINVICALLAPLMSNLHYGALVVMRIGQGVGGGVTFPAMHCMLAHWAPPNERSVMSSIVYAGTALGTVIFTLISGVIAGFCGWEAVFYIEGGVSILWIVVWLWLVADTPEKQRYISGEERAYIAQSLTAGEKRAPHPPMPWRAALTSPAFLAILVAHTCSNWGWYMVLIELPTYMKNVLNFNIKSNAIISSIPFLCMWVFSMVLSKVLDTLLARKRMNTTTARKIATSLASIVPLICFIILCYVGCHRILAVVLMTVAIMSIGGMFCGFLSNHIDIAPNFAGSLIAITNTVATIPGIIVPIFVGHLTHSDPSIHSWRIIFITTVVLYVVEAVVYLLFASGQIQPWNELPSDNFTSEGQPLKSPTKSEEDNKQYDSTSNK